MKTPKPPSALEAALSQHIRAAKLPEPERECLQCKRLFMPKRVGGRHKGLFCSVECSMESRKVTRVCAGCGASFRFPRSEARYCSQECRAKIGSRNMSWKGGKELRHCPKCGGGFMEFPSVSRKHCSSDCANKNRPDAAGSANPNWRGGGKQMNCSSCGIAFTANRSAVEAKYCSRTCFVKDSFDRSSPRWAHGSRFGMSGARGGKRSDIGIYVRSSWEANYARYLNLLVRLKQIASWEYEAETFEFPVKRGTRFYTPDFKVMTSCGAVEYHEVKGWMHPKGKTALARMALHHPSVKIILIQQKEYREITRKVSALIPGWE